MTVRGLLIPLHNYSYAVLQADFPMTEEDWAILMVIIAAMKPGLVAPEQEVK